MSDSAHSAQIPLEFAPRLRTLFGLGSKPETLDQFGEFLQERLKERLKEPGVRESFQAIYEGKEIFGQVDYLTRHMARISGRQVNVACALDALIQGFFSTVEIDSSCFHCSEPIKVKMSGGIVDFVKPSTVVLWLGASQESMASCCTDNLCPYINFFSSPEHIAEWKDKNPKELGMTLTLQQSLELARKGWWEPVHSLLETENHNR